MVLQKERQSSRIQVGFIRPRPKFCTLFSVLCCLLNEEIKEPKGKPRCICSPPQIQNGKEVLVDGKKRSVQKPRGKKCKDAKVWVDCMNSIHIQKKEGGRKPSAVFIFEKIKKVTQSTIHTQKCIQTIDRKNKSKPLLTQFQTIEFYFSSLERKPSPLLLHEFCFLPSISS